MWEQNLNGGGGGGCRKREKPDWLESTFHAQPACLPACPLRPLLRTPALTHTPRALPFCLKGPSHVPPALSGFSLKERERLKT